MSTQFSRLGHPKFTYTLRAYCDHSIYLGKFGGFWCYRIWHKSDGALSRMRNGGYASPMSALKAAKRAIDLDPAENPALN